MRSTLSFGLLALSAAAVPASAQYGAGQAPAQARAVPSAQEAATTAPAPLCQANISKGARKTLVDLQTAVMAKNMAAIPALVASAQALAKTDHDKCFIGQMQIKAAVDSNDMKGAAAALEAQLALGVVPPTTIANLYENLAEIQSDAGAHADAGNSLERSLQIAPNRASATIMLAETRVNQNRVADALALFQKAIATEVAAGRMPIESWYKRPVAVAYGAKNPATHGLLRAWVAAYPSSTSWREAIRVHAMLSGLGNAALLDMSRLARLNRALAGDADYGNYAAAALGRGFPGEAKAVLDEGFAAGAINRNQPTLKATHASATAKAAGDRASLDTLAAAAAAGGTAKSLMTLAEAYHGYGDYAKAAALVRAAQGKPGVDAELANLRLGMALAAAGDKAGAKAALDLATGPQAEVARYWLTYVATRP